MINLGQTVKSLKVAMLKKAKNVAALQFCFSLPTQRTDFWAQIVLMKAPYASHAFTPAWEPCLTLPKQQLAPSSPPHSALWSGFSWQLP